MNPTSGTIGKEAYTAQYCFWLPGKIDTGHNAYASYGLTEDLEVGAIGLWRERSGGDLSAAGPSARYRLRRDTLGGLPEISLGIYAPFGDQGLEKVSGYASAFKRAVIDPTGPVRAVGLHGGLRHEKPDGGDDSTRGFVGLEVQLPARLYVVGEVMTEDKDQGDDGMPYALGVQWRASGFNISTGAIENNVSDGSPYFFFGIGSVLTF